MASYLVYYQQTSENAAWVTVECKCWRMILWSNVAENKFKLLGHQKENIYFK
jgi:hypothetical protein